MEFWDLYDKNRVFTGKTIKRGVTLQEGEYHLVVEVWTVNGKGEVLLTKRHPSKPHGNLWESTAGSVICGEEPIDAALRELFEETGIKAFKDELVYLGELRGNHNFIKSYLVKKDIDIKLLNLQEEEVTDAKWANINEFEEMKLKNQIVDKVIKRFDLYRSVIMNY